MSDGRKEFPIYLKSVIENKLFENKYKIEKTPEVRFDKFVKDYFLPYSKLHKKTYPDDVLVCNMLFETFGSLSLTEITPPMIEFKQKRLEGETMYKRKRNPATVNRELCVLSKIFSLAFDAELIDSNPCRRVRKFRTDTRRTRYLTFDEEARLFEKLEGQEWVQRIVTMAINTGMRQGEIFDLIWFDVDNLTCASLTGGGCCGSANCGGPGSANGCTLTCSGGGTITCAKIVGGVCQ